MRLVVRALRGHEKGQSVAEFGVVVTVFLLLVSGIVDFGRVLNAWIVVSASAREGARQAAIGQPPERIGATARAFAVVPGVGPGDVAVDVSYSRNPPQVGDAATVRVTVRRFPIVTPLAQAAFGCVGAPTCSIPIGSATTMRYEGPYLQ